MPTKYINFVYYLNKLNPEVKTIIRKIEKLNYKLNNAENAVIFINNCIYDSLNPNIYIYICCGIMEAYSTYKFSLPQYHRLN